MKFFTRSTNPIKKETDESVYQDIQKQRLIKDMERTRQDMEAAYANLDNVIEPDLIDCYIYQVNAILKRYKYLMEQAEKLNLSPAPIIDPLYEETSAASFVQING